MKRNKIERSDHEELLSLKRDMSWVKALLVATAVAAYARFIIDGSLFPMPHFP